MTLSVDLVDVDVDLDIDFVDVDLDVDLVDVDLVDVDLVDVDLVDVDLDGHIRVIYGSYTGHIRIIYVCTKVLGRHISLIDKHFTYFLQK